jgi:hypothetical protein
MISPQDAARLEGIIRREGRSLLQYVSEAFPWVRTGTDEALTRLQQLVGEERDAVAALSRFLVRRRHTPPYLGSYPMAFTTMNFVSLDFLVPRLAEQQRRAIAELEKDRQALTDAEAKVEVDKVLQMKRQHLQTLEALAPATAAH